MIGDRVRIKAGPMTGMEGILLRKKNSFRVVLALDAIVAVGVDAEDLEPVAKSACRVVLPPDFALQPNRQIRDLRPTLTGCE